MASSADTLPPGASFVPGNHVGVELQEARLRAGLDLRLVAEDLRIRYHQLLAIEEGRFQDLPGPTYATGFIRAYAEYLGLSAEDVVRRHKAGPGPADGAGTELEFPAPARDGGLSAGAFLLVALVLAGLGFGGWYWMSSSNATLGEVVAGLQARVTAWVEEPDEDTEPGASGSPAEDPQVASAGDAPEAEAGGDPATADAAQDAPQASPQEASETDPLVAALDSPPDQPEGADGNAVADETSEADTPADQGDVGADRATEAQASPTTTADDQPLPPEPPAEPLSEEGTDGAANDETGAANEADTAAEPGTEDGAVDSAGDGPDAAAPAPEEGVTDPQTATVPDDSAEQSADAGTDAATDEATDEAAPEADLPAIPDADATEATDAEPVSDTDTADADPAADAAEDSDAQAQDRLDQDQTGEETTPTADEAQADEETAEQTEETATAEEETSVEDAAEEETAEEETAEEQAEEEEPTPAYVGRPAPASVREAGSGSRIVLRASRDSWIQVREGGDLVVRRLLRRGDTYVVPLGSSYTLNTTNAGGLEVYVDGRRRPNLGPVGAARNGIRLTPGALN